MGTGADMGAELTAGLGGGLAVEAELPQTLGPPPCSSPSVQHLSAEVGTRGVGGSRRWVPSGMCGGHSPLPCERPGGSTEL